MIEEYITIMWVETVETLGERMMEYQLAYKIVDVVAEGGGEYKLVLRLKKVFRQQQEAANFSYNWYLNEDTTIT